MGTMVTAPLGSDLGRRSPVLDVTADQDTTDLYVLAVKLLLNDLLFRVGHGPNPDPPGHDLSLCDPCLLLDKRQSSHGVWVVARHRHHLSLGPTSCAVTRS